MKPCKTKEDILNRMSAYKRLCRIKKMHPTLPPTEIYGINISKTGAITLDDLVKGLNK